MPALVQICIVIVTIGLLSIAVVSMTRFHKATRELSQLTHELRGSLVKFDLAAQEARALVASLPKWFLWSPWADDVRAYGSPALSRR